jgi:hypothetical protein
MEGPGTGELIIPNDHCFFKAVVTGIFNKEKIWVFFQFGIQTIYGYKVLPASAHIIFVNKDGVLTS